MKFEPRENREPEAPLNGKQGPGHWMLKYEESIGGGGTPSGASSLFIPARGVGTGPYGGTLIFAAVYYTSGHLP